MKDVHELRQFVSTKLASCTSHLNLLDAAMQNHCTKIARISANLEAFEKRAAMTKVILVHAGLREVRVDIQKTHEEITTIQGNWEAATAKLQGLDSEVENVRAYIQTIS